VVRARHLLAPLLACALSCATPTPAASPARAPGAAHSGAASGTAAEPDRDHDGIANECDVCPDEPETMNGVCDEDGCPDVPTMAAPAAAQANAAFPQGTITIQSVLLFDKQSTKLAPVTLPLVDQVARSMVTNKDVVELVAVVGHASRDESDGDATGLSRAAAVRDALVARGVDAAHLEAHSAGARRPFAEKDAPLNRRVEFVVLRAAGREQFRLEGDSIAEIPAARAGAGAVCRPRPATCSR